MIEALASKTEIYSALQTNARYAGWQNKKVLSQWPKSWGPVPEGYRRRLEQGVLARALSEPPVYLDISLNPGRVANSVDMPVEVAAEMWLGPAFWSYAACSKADVLAADFILEKRDTPHFLYIKSWPHPFTRPDGEQGRVQQKLWRLLFNEDCEWPPGSGGISDEPVGGPPELMPPGPYAGAV